MSEDQEKKGAARRAPSEKLIDFTMPALLEALQSVRTSGLKQAEFTCKSDRNKKVLIYPSGRIVFFTRVRYQGHRYRIELGKLGENTLEQIHQNYLNARQQESQGLDPRTIRRKALTFGELFDEHYVVQCRSRGKKSLKTDLARYEHWLKPTFGDKLLNVINATMASQLVIKMQDQGLAPATINNTIGLAKAVLNLAVGMELLPKNPLGITKPLPVNNRRTTFLTVQDLAAFTKAASACTGEEFVGARLLMLAALTGARLGELLAARFSDIDMDAGIWKLPDQKSGKPGLIHLSDAAKTVINELETVRVNEMLFPGCRGNDVISRPIKLYKRICRRAGIGDHWRIHDLRHGFCSAAILGGTPIEIVSHAARHSSPVVTRIYSHPHQESLRAANENVARLIAGEKAA